MKKSSLLLVFCLLITMCTGCTARKAPSQLKNSPYLHVRGTTVMNAENSELQFSTQNLPLGDKSADDVLAVIGQSSCNGILLRLTPDNLNTDSDWGLTEQTAAVLRQLFTAVPDDKYLFIGIDEIPDILNAWYDGSDFADNITGLWQNIGTLCKDCASVGGYVLDRFTLPGSDGKHTSMQIYEQFLTKLCAGIRTVDKQHMLLIGTMYADLDVLEHRGFPFVKDANYAYLAHPGDLDFYTNRLQNESVPRHLVYPNAYWRDIDNLKFFSNEIGSDINLSSTEYQTRATKVINIEQDGLFCRLGAYVLPENTDCGGEMRIKDLRFVECDAKGNEIKEIYALSSTVGVPFTVADPSGAESDASVYDDGTAYLESVDGELSMYVSNLNIPLEKGKHYQLTVTVKQRGMSAKYRCAPLVITYTSDAHEVFDKNYIAKYFSELFAEAQSVGVPLFYDGVLPTNDPQSDEISQYKTDVLSVISDLRQSYTVD